jgi:hypothetical protein
MGNIKPYKWVPGTGPSLDAIERMRERFKKPSVLMGEAWFNSLDRRMYPELNDDSVFQNLGPIKVSQILFEISSGTSCFGHMEEWDDWFRYLLPDLIMRSNDYQYWERLLLQSVITSFFAIFWKGIDEEYDGFRNDIMASLSHSLMDPKLWDSSAAEIRPIFLDRFRDGKGNLKLMWNAGEADNNLSAAMFFCLKYLYENEIPNWVKSLTEISHVLWQANLVVWTLGAFDLLKDKLILPVAIEAARPQISWEH